MVFLKRLNGLKVLICVKLRDENMEIKKVPLIFPRIRRLQGSRDFGNFLWKAFKNNQEFMKTLSKEQIEEIKEEIQIGDEEPLFHPIEMIQEFEDELWQAFIKSPREPIRIFYNWNWLILEKYGGLF